MDMYVIEGGNPLRGTVTVSGSKNACLPLMCAALLADGMTILENVPNLRDIRSMVDLLEHLNVKIIFRHGRMVIDSRGFDTEWVPYELMRKMRASMYAFGPIIARRRKAAVSKPGGCNIGSRPIDLHLRGFQNLGVSIAERKGYIHASHDGLKGSDMVLSGKSGPSVGATCNVLMAAVLAEGTTTIRGAAREPEVQELIGFLTAMGAQIDGIGTNTLVIEGIKKLQPIQWSVAPDRIEAATYAAAALITDGDLLIKHCEPTAMTASLWALRQWGAQIDHVDDSTIRVRRAEDRKPTPMDLTTEPYPGLATDIQPAIVSLLGLTAGASSIKETIYPDRFMHIDELNRLGACMRVEGDMVHILGVDRYEGAAVMSPDLRAGAALVLAALAAEGESQVRRIYHIERGYERFEQKLAALGARIRRTVEDEIDPGFDGPMWNEDAPVANPEEVETYSDAATQLDSPASRL
jgi:UDP-N-acetylglucosamine 1-carboxyvinyltransferase